MKKSDIGKTMKIKLDYKKANMFAHCNHCLKKGLPYNESPDSYMNYQMTSYPFTYPDKTKANILVVWCKKCKREIWDSRHLTHLF
jgi:hypothetical protein